MVLAWDGVMVYLDFWAATLRGLLDMGMEYARWEGEYTMLDRLDLWVNLSACVYDRYGPALTRNSFLALITHSVYTR